MTWPSSDVNTTAMDSGSDTPPRAEIKSWADKFNQMRNHVSTFMQGLLDDGDAATARTTLDVPSRSGGNASGTWGVDISGNAATATALTATLAIASGGTGQTTASAAFTALKQTASDTATGVVELATAAELNTGTDTARVAPVSILRENMLYGISAVSMSGQSIIEWLSIPSWVKRISIPFSAMSSSAASPINLRAGTSGGLVAAGYSGSVQLVANTGVDSAPSTGGARVTSTADAASTHSGRLVVERLPGTNIWTITGVISQSDTTRGSFVAVSISLASALTRLAIYPDSGTFDSGTIGAIYE